MTRPERPSDPEPRSAEGSRGPFTYADEGAGPVIVGVHGLPGTLRDFRWLAPSLTAHFRFVRLDLPGFGGTPWSTWPGYTPNARAAFVLDAIRALELPKPLILGHSMGGVVGCAAAELAEPGGLRGLALVSSPGLRPHRAFRRIPRRPLSKWFSSPRRTKLLLPVLRRAFELQGFRGPYPDEALLHTLHGIAAVDFAEHGPVMRRLRLPTAMFWCDDDPLIEPAIPAEAAEVLPCGPRRRFPDGGHNPQKAHAVEIAETLQRWMQDDWTTLA